MITAVGERNGKEMEVLVTNNRSFFFDDKENIELERELKDELNMRHSMGCFFPERDSVLNYINVLQNYFFDYNALVRTDEEVEELEHEDGRVY